MNRMKRTGSLLQAVTPRIAAAMILTIIAAVLSACQEIMTPITGWPQPVNKMVLTKSFTEAAFPGEQKTGNLNRNYTNSGLVAEQDEWIWYSEWPDLRLSRMRQDSTEITHFEATGIRWLNIAGNSLYYVQAIDGESAGRIYRKSLESGRVTQVSPIRVNIYGGCIIVDDWIYFTKLDDGNSLHRMKRDGSGVIQLNDRPTFQLNAEAGWIFYSTQTGRADSDKKDYEIHQMKLDGSEDSLLVKSGDGRLLADRGWLYYTDACRLHRVRYDKTEDSKILDAIKSLTLAGDRLIFTVRGSGQVLSSQLDGSAVKDLGIYVNDPVQIAGEWIYFLDPNRNGERFRIRLDGSGLEKVGQP